MHTPTCHTTTGFIIRMYKLIANAFQAASRYVPWVYSLHVLVHSANFSWDIISYVTAQTNKTLAEMDFITTRISVNCFDVCTTHPTFAHKSKLENTLYTDSTIFFLCRCTSTNDFSIVHICVVVMTTSKVQSWSKPIEIYKAKNKKPNEKKKQ